MNQQPKDAPPQKGKIVSRFEPKDIHVVVSGKTNTCRVFLANGHMIRTMPAFPHGAYGPRQDVTGGDTVEATYQLVDPIWTRKNEDQETRRKFGWVFIRMLDIQGKEALFHRSGIGAHGGGHIRDYWEPKQELTWTMGCVRFQNVEAEWLAHLVESTTKSGGKVYMTVSQ